MPLLVFLAAVHAFFFLCVATLYAQELTADTSVVSRALDQVESPSIENVQRVSQSGMLSEKKGETSLAIRLTIAVFEVTDMDIRDALTLLEVKSGLRIIIDNDLSARVSVYLRDIDVFDALRVILEMHDLAYVRDGSDTVRVMTAKRFAAAAGSPFNEVVTTALVPISYTKPADIVQALTQIKSPQGKVLPNAQMSLDGPPAIILIDAPDTVAAMAALAKALDVPVEKKTFTVKHASIADIAALVTALLTPKVGSLVSDEKTHTVTVTDTPVKIAEIAAAITDFDYAKGEIMLDAHIVRVFLNEEHDEGIDWEAIVSEYVEVPATTFIDKKGQPLSGSVGMGIISEEDAAVLLDALDTVGVVSTLATSQIIATYKKTASLTMTETDVAVVSGTGMVKDVFEGDDQVVLRITPQPDDANTFKLSLQLAHVAMSSEGIAAREPDVVNQETVMTVPQGNVLIVGGLFQRISVESLKKGFILGRIPILGFPFRSRSSYQQKAELIIFITPHAVVTNP